jgi:putative phage-type endonuclease
MFISDDDKKCLKQKNYKDLEIAVSEFISLNNIVLTEINTEAELNEIASVIEVIYKDIYCEQEAKSDLEELLITMLKAIIPIKEPTYCESDLNYLELKMDELQIIPQPEQRTQEWYEYRNNRLTASDLWSVMDENQSKIYDILKKKCGVDKPYKPGAAMLHGIKFEAVATHIYEMRNNVEIIEFGCMPHRFIPYFGASPDGICGIKSVNKDFVGRMLEIKCPKSRVITGFIPEVYRAQMQGQLEVCELEYCDYLECDFQVYNSKEDYLNDFYIYNEDGIEKKDYSRTKTGNEKGGIMEIFDTSTKSYKYSYYYEPMSTNEEITQWEDPFIDKIIESDNLEHGGTILWYLNNINTVLVKRDKKWFCDNFYKIKNFWNSVEDARINGIPEKKKKEPPKLDMTQFTGTYNSLKPLDVVINFINDDANV